MEEQKECFFTIGELADMIGVTVRTLQYYDKIGLLESTFNKGGRRQYTKNDILKLQQILFLKSLGFSLKQINNKILKPESSDNLEKIFTQQSKILKAQIQHLNKIVDMLDTVIANTKLGEGISIHKLMTIMELMRQDNQYAFILRYFGDEQIESAANRFGSSNDYDDFTDESKEVFAQLDLLYRRGADPAGKDGQELAARWWNMVNKFTNNDPSLLEPLLAAGRDIDNWPKETKIFQDAIQHFLAKALDVYLHNKGIPLSEMGENTYD